MQISLEVEFVPSCRWLLFEGWEQRLNSFFWLSTFVFFANSTCWEPILIVLVFSLHSRKVIVQISFNSFFSAEVCIHPCVVACLQAFLLFGLIVVEILGEVFECFSCEFALLQAVLEYHSLCCIIVQTLFILGSGLRIYNMPFQFIFSTCSSAM